VQQCPVQNENLGAGPGVGFGRIVSIGSFLPMIRAGFWVARRSTTAFPDRLTGRAHEQEPGGAAVIAVSIVG
jgi:hypothetical protein